MRVSIAPALGVIVRRIALVFVLLFTLHAAVALAGVTAAVVSDLRAAAGTDTLLVVVGDADDATRAALFAFARREGVWQEVFSASAFVGKAGIVAAADKREGDGKTPAGVYALGRAFGVLDDPGSRIPYTKLRPGDCWVDDPQSRHYNTWVRADAPDKDWRSAENLAREKIAYAHALVIEYNTRPIVPGAGSAIFLHCATGRATAGCVSVSESAMKKALAFAGPGTRIVIAPSLEALGGY